MNAPTRIPGIVRRPTGAGLLVLVMLSGTGAAARAQPREAPPVREQPAALVNGEPVTWGELQPMLAEAAGGAVLQEAVLDRLLMARSKTQAILITPDDIAAERRLLVDTIARDAGAGPDDAERLLERVRQTRGLGEERFTRLLDRNARMRKLVAPTVQVSEEEVAQAAEMLLGAKYRIRVLVTKGQGDAAAIRRDLTARLGAVFVGQQVVGSALGCVLVGEPFAWRTPAAALSEAFARAAMKSSIDTSAGRGGLLEPISTADPAYPSSVRQCLRTLVPGQVSPVLAVDRGFALVLLEEVVPGESPILEASLASVRERVRARRQRRAMDALAEQLLGEAQIRVMDRSLEWSRRTARPASSPP
jgi:hypothetical protein